jgi:hypothetical protein
MTMIARHVHGKASMKQSDAGVLLFGLATVASLAPNNINHAPARTEAQAQALADNHEILRRAAAFDKAPGMSLQEALKRTPQASRNLKLGSKAKAEQPTKSLSEWFGSFLPKWSDSSSSESALAVQQTQQQAQIQQQIQMMQAQLRGQQSSAQTGTNLFDQGFLPTLPGQSASSIVPDMPAIPKSPTLQSIPGIPGMLMGAQSTQPATMPVIQPTGNLLPTLFGQVSQNVTLSNLQPCRDYILITARGTGEDQTDPNGSRNLIRGVLAQVPRGAFYQVTYPASMAYLSSPEAGVKDMVGFVEALDKVCPQTRLALHGYSEGAMVIIAALSKAPFDPAAEQSASTAAAAANGVSTSRNFRGLTVDQRVRAAVAFGNPYYIGGELQNRGPASGRGIGLIKDVLTFSDTAWPKRMISRTRDYCRKGDPVCNGLGISLLTDGFAEHHYVGTLEEEDALRFVVAMLREP